MRMDVLKSKAREEKNMTRKKRYFAQTHDTRPGHHRSAYFDDLDAAREFLRKHGGGTIKERGVKIIRSSGHGLGKVVFDPLLKTWGVIEVVDKTDD